MRQAAALAVMEEELRRRNEVRDEMARRRRERDGGEKGRGEKERKKKEREREKKMGATIK